jgi:hypothetical protein
MLQGDEIESTLVAASFLIVPLLLIVIFPVAADHGTLYVTGSQFYEGCSQRKASSEPSQSRKRAIQARQLSGINVPL